MRLRDWIAGLHYAPGGGLSPWLWLLLPLELFYRTGVALRLLAYQQGWLQKHRPEVPVISVGNLTTGGTGKTPIVIEIARGLIKAGKTVVILSRGYGAPEPIAYGRAMDPKHGDEAYLIQQEVPEAIVIVGRNRVQNLQRAVHDYRPDYVILDDGFQHLRLHRDINILLIDGERLVGNGHMLPAGPLREPLEEIQRADLVFITKEVSPETMQTVERWVKQFQPRPPRSAAQVVPVSFQPVGLRNINNANAEPVEDFKDRPVIAFSGIAKPAQFETDMKALGLDLLKHVRFTDHYVYTAADIRDILSLAEPQEEPLLVTTEKDLVKVRHLIPAQWQERTYTLQVSPALDGQWFYYEFLTQMPGYTRAGDGHVHSGHRR